MSVNNHIYLQIVIFINMNSFNTVFEDFQWTTMNLLQSAWEAGNINIKIGEYMQIENTVKEALGNYKTKLEIYNRFPRRSETTGVGLTDVDGSVKFLPFQKDILHQMKLDAKILIKDLEEKADEGMNVEELEAFIRGSIVAWKEHSGMIMLNQMIEKPANPIDLFP